MNRPCRVFTTEQQQQIVDWYVNEKVAVYAIAKRLTASGPIYHGYDTGGAFNRLLHNIRALLKRNGIAIDPARQHQSLKGIYRGNTKNNTARSTEVLDLYNQGLTTDQIAQRLNVTHGTAYYYVKRYGTLRAPLKHWGKSQTAIAA